MARILHNNEWFEEISSRGHYEAEFERVLQQEASRLFPDYHFVPFKTTVFSEIDADSRQADYALIHQNYRSWWVVEVELGHHSFEGHVLPQVRTLTRAYYGLAEVDYLCSQSSVLNRDKVTEMLKGSPPKVLVIVNSIVPRWAEQLRPFGARVVICQIFRSRFNKYVMRINGEYPSENEEVITTCECDYLIHRFLKVHAPTQLSLDSNGRVLLYYEGQATEWERIDTSGQVYLHALRDHNLRVGKRYEIIKQGDGTLAVRLAR